MAESTRRKFLTQAGPAIAAATVVGTTAEGQTTRPAGWTKRVIPGGTGWPFSRATIFAGTAHVSGVLGTKPGSRDLAGPDFESQCRQCLENLKASIEAAGSSIDLVLKCNCFLTEAADFAKFNELYTRVFANDPPARSTVVVKELVLTGAKVEIDCIAVVP